MKHGITGLIAACAIALPGIAWAQGAPPGGGRQPDDVNNSLVSDVETHVVRGLLERSNTSIGYARIALARSQSDRVKAAAQGYIDAMTTVSANLRAEGLSLKISGISGGMPRGAGGPPSGAPGGAPGGPPGGAPGGGGGPPGGMARSGPGVYAAKFTAELNSLSGDQFDEIYELRTLEYLEDMERTLLNETLTGATPALRDWARANAKTYEAQAMVFARLAFGETGGGGPPPGVGGPGGAAPGGGPAQ